MSAYRVLTHLAMPEGVVHPGAVVELDDLRGATLTKMHVVEPYVAEVPTTEKEVVPGILKATSAGYVYEPTAVAVMAPVVVKRPRAVKTPKAPKAQK